LESYARELDPVPFRNPVGTHFERCNSLSKRKGSATTNDLDIPALEVLEDSLAEFPGALVIVSHDPAGILQ
jgi:hypothetical protein